MKLFTYKVQQQVRFALLITTGLIFTSIQAHADDLEKAIKISEASVEAPLFSRQLILRKSPLSDVWLSPDGQKLVYIVARGKHRQVWLHDQEDDQHRQLFSSKNIDDLFWSQDSGYLFFTTENGVGVLPVAEDKTPALLVKIKTENDEAFKRIDENHPHAVLVSLRPKKDDPHILYRILPTGEKIELYQSDRIIVDVLTNSIGRAAIVKHIKGQGFEVINVKNSKKQFMFRCDADDPCSLKKYDSSTGSLYIKTRFNADLVGLYKVNVGNNEKDLIHQHPEGWVDMGVPYFDKLTSSPYLVSYRDDHISWYGLSEEIRQTVQTIKNKVQDDNLLFQVSDDKKTWLVLAAWAKERATRYYVYDVHTQQLTEPLRETVQKLLTDAPLPDPQLLALRVAVRYTVSDGMAQQGYVTLPRGKKMTDVPLIVMPHGGPWSRDFGHYNSTSQFLANRGYAVFQPNFRASIGFGRAYKLSANRDFGNGRVQQDILDGMEYVLSRGIGDRSKLGIFGHSFGGFSVLTALTFTPNLFQVGVAGAPPSDLAATLTWYNKNAKSEKQQLRMQMFKHLVVDPNNPIDMQRIQSQSPNAHKEKLKKPLYLWAGGKDPKVSILDVRNYALAQHAMGNKITLLVEPSAGHSPKETLHREAYFYMLEKAMHKHLGGKFEEKISFKLRHYITRSTVLNSNNFMD